MKIEPNSRWLAEIREGEKVTAKFDTPKCAFYWQRTKKLNGEIYLRGYYTQTVQPVSKLVLAVGGDVLGPMGTDFVPVEPEHGEKFKKEHNARTILKSSELTDDLVADPK